MPESHRPKRYGPSFPIIDPNPRIGEPTKPRLFRFLGPGLVTSASDDDPSGIATYAQAGAQFGYTVAWTLLLTYPLMAAIQMICARVGRTTGQGIAGNVVRTYPTWVVIAITTPLLIANIGANLGAMADALALLAGGSVFLYVALFSVSCVGMQILLKYKRYVAALKWLALALMSSIGTLLFVDIEWGSLLWGLVVPQMSLDADYLAIVVAILGTTISPYLFFLAGLSRSGGPEGEANQGTARGRSRPGKGGQLSRSVGHDGGHGIFESRSTLNSDKRRGHTA